jgi:hypothetical protein
MDRITIEILSGASTGANRSASEESSRKLSRHFPPHFNEPVMDDRDAHAMTWKACSRHRACFKAVSALRGPDGIVPPIFRSTMDFPAVATLVWQAPFFETFMAFTDRSRRRPVIGHF